MIFTPLLKSSSKPVTATLRKEALMKSTPSFIKACLVVCLAMVMCAGIALAEELKMVGTVTKIELAGDGQSATAVLQDKKSGEEVTIVVTDELTLDKFKDKRIVEGDEIRCKFEKENGKNNSKFFRKTAGC